MNGAEAPVRGEATAAAPVVVAVGADGSPAAVQRGVEEALRRGLGLHLVHATRAGADAGRALDRALRAARSGLGGRAPLTAGAGAGSVAAVVAMAGDRAPLVVTGRRAHPVPDPGSHLVPDPSHTASATVAIAAHVRAPVLNVPAWTDAAVHGGPVVVGLDLLGAVEDPLREAVAAARASGAPVHLVSARSRPVRGSVSAAAAASTGEEPDRQLADLLERWATEAPEVETELLVSPDGAAEALLAASRSASLVVLGRHEPWVPRGSLLGPVARSVLRSAPCPVLVAAPSVVHGTRARADRAPLGVG